MITSPLGTPGCSTLAESTGYFSAGACENADVAANKHTIKKEFFIDTEDSEKPRLKGRIKYPNSEEGSIVDFLLRAYWPQ